ncbi:hypothetical protein B0H14DRAFT_2637593, partial [Mycena olivaceomarginata]
TRGAPRAVECGYGVEGGDGSAARDAGGRGGAATDAPGGNGCGCRWWWARHTEGAWDAAEGVHFRARADSGLVVESKFASSVYTCILRSLRGWIDKSTSVFAQEEEEAAKMTHELFTDTRGLTKSDWYDWKLRWIEGLRETVDEGLEVLRQLQTMPDEVLPALERKYEEIMQELEQQAEASIAEQNVEVEALQAEVAESNAQLQWLQERLEELELEKWGARTAIADANPPCLHNGKLPWVWPAHGV